MCGGGKGATKDSQKDSQKDSHTHTHTHTHYSRARVKTHTSLSVTVGPSYPQGVSVVAPAPVEHLGFYVVATNNKEDVWVAKLSYGSF